MRITTAASILSAVAISGGAAQKTTGNTTTGILGNAKAIDDNPSGAQFTATLPDTAFDTAAFPDGGNVKGSIQAVSMPDGSGVMFHVAFSGLPDAGGPFLYHIHDQPVPANGNCTSTLAHLDPYQRGETPACDASAPDTCQVGDLSGKHGKVTSTDGSFTSTYAEAYASTLEGIGAYFGNRSFVLHYANTTRITCANFAAVAAASGSGSCSSSTTTTSGSTRTTSTTSKTTATGSAATTTTRRTNATATATSTPTPVTVSTGYANLPSMVFAIGAAALIFLL